MDISFEAVEHRYMQGTPFEKVALSDFSVAIPSGSFTAVIGHTGSGKSTFIQHMNGLLKPTKGTVRVGPYTIEPGKKKSNMKELRKNVGLVFQYPEHQLFEETVEKDICFGPMNYGVTKEEAERIARELLPQVGLDEQLLHVSPFQLSGGQMRRVAIAGVLAMNPSVLVLDEPAASLDPEGKQQIMDLFMDYHKKHKTTTILVTHDMEDAATYADHIIVLNKGQVEMVGDREDVFKRTDALKEIGLDFPESIHILERMKEEFQIAELPLLFSLEEAADYIASFVKVKWE